MQLDSRTVALCKCPAYDRQLLAQTVNAVTQALSFRVPRGSRILLKPNLVTCHGQGPACTDAAFVAAVAVWFLDHGAKVTIGDSPAFGSATDVMAALGMSEVLRPLPVRMVNFSKPHKLRLDCGIEVTVAGQALDCDVLVNLPKVKAHSQLLVSLAVKNYFGVILGWRKAWLHLREGGVPGHFAAMLVDLLAVLPQGLTLADGIIAMHRQGPVLGEPYLLGLVAGSPNPVAADTAILEVLGVAPTRSPLWQECQRRGLPGCETATLDFPLAQPDALRTDCFLVPKALAPVRFHPGRVCRGLLKRLAARINTR